MSDVRTDKDRQHTGELYYPGAPEIIEEQLQLQDLMYEYNLTRPSDMDRRDELLQKMLGGCGRDVIIEPPFHANFGGRYCYFEDRVYANFNLTCVDDTEIHVGADTMMGPGVTLVTAAHPLLPELRERAFQYNAPVHIGKRCWLGAGVIVLPGVTIGDDTTIGAGSVVTRDIPAGVLALGTPCRVVREIGEKERTYYFRDRKIPWGELEGRGH